MLRLLEIFATLLSVSPQWNVPSFGTGRWSLLAKVCNMEIAPLLIVWILVMGGIGAAIGSSRGNGTAGFFLGALLGFIGWIIVALISRTPETEAEYQRKVALASGVIQTGERVAAQWGTDPFGRYGHRWWNGSQWTNRVATRGEEALDEPVHSVPGAGDGWADDPFGRFAKREYKNGLWTHLVARDAKTVLSDPPVCQAPVPPPPTD